jgi:hypothetical protein
VAGLTVTNTAEAWRYRYWGRPYVNYYYGPPRSYYYGRYDPYYRTYYGPRVYPRYSTAYYTPDYYYYGPIYR